MYDDYLVNIFNIWEHNDSWYHWSRFGQKPGKDFPAQTTLASSYGLLQTMYFTALDMGFAGGWRGEGDNPSKLFDPETSLDLGNSYLLKKAKTIQPLKKAKINNSILWDIYWIMAVQGYNLGKMNYGADVLLKSKKYSPE